MVSALILRLQQIRLVMRFSAFDTTTEEGRSNERHRRILLTGLAAAFSKIVSVGTVFISIPLTLHYLGAERFEANGQRSKELGTVNTGTTSGRESVLIIVSEAQPGMPQADFAFLGQPTLAATRGGGDNLRDLLEASGFQPERTRGLTQPAAALSTTAFRLFSWDAARK